MAEFPVGNTQDSAIVFPFTAIDLTAAIDVLPNQWGLLGDSGMFEEVGVDTTIVEINYRDGFVNLLASAERGSIPQAVGADDEGAVFIKAPHFPDTDLITPKDLENRWAFVAGDAQPRRRRTLQDEVTRRLAKIAFRHDLALEYLRMGAIKGQLYDGKGKLLLDLFNAFGITQKVFTFTLSDAAYEVQQATFDVARYIELNMHGDVHAGVDCLVDPLFFNKLTAHPLVKQFWINYRDAAIYRGDQRKQFDFGALRFIEYNAQVPTAPLSGLLQQQYNEFALDTNGATAEGNGTLHFIVGSIPAEVGAGWVVSDTTNAAAIAANTTVTAVNFGAGTLTISANAVAGSGGVGNGDEIVFQPPSIKRFIEPNTGYCYPRDTRDTFRTYFAPPFTIQNIADVGMKRFVSPKILDHGKGIELFSESNPLPLCRRPNALAKVVLK
jgi:hypothetical protein